MKRFLIGGTHSGCGKTTVTCGVLAALKKRGLTVSSFKCGSDYIDPMFHERIVGAHAYNLDSFFCGDDTLKFLLYDRSISSDVSVIEGVMGFYDGYNGRGSAYSVSEVTETPAAIVVDCKGMSDSIGAVVKGFLNYREPNRIAGFIFNRLPERLVGLAKEICAALDTEFLGYLPPNDFVIESRHLGLLTPNEIGGLKEKIEGLGALAERCISLDRLLAISERPFPDFRAPTLKKLPAAKPPVIAVARDEAFCFLYSENLALLEKTGCEICFFSPLTDRRIPDNACGLILCGGYPELYARRLAENVPLRRELYRKIRAGLPTIAECGGFIYLHKSFEDEDGTAREGVGIIDGKAFKTPKLQRFGYIELTAEADNLLSGRGEKFPAHEFHYWDSEKNGDGFIARKNDGRRWRCVHAGESLYAGFPHLYFYAAPRIAERFVQKCIEYGGTNG
ncbi:MAG: cobyrinate a,c-diamide synthase [Bacteroides sp.]|nr:cobyrinate a,c-diamide synthase [Eubacterium sp.]MCM1417859.1 cobyrinate a,c-diamide synthase [Roseburia sp.]MCM1461298.1 cobyrinate a,c-diamide synthase [Bacteroides sp.]